MKIANNYGEKLQKQITVKLTETQYNEILEISKKLDRHPSEFMRKAILAQIEQITKLLTSKKSALKGNQEGCENKKRPVRI